MDEVAIKQIIRMTIAEMRRQEMVQDAEKIAYTQTADLLYKFYESDSDDDLRNALDSIQSDKYFDIIPAFYRDGCTVEQIADFMEVDSRTIARNKRRLCLEIYMLIS